MAKYLFKLKAEYIVWRIISSREGGVKDRRILKS